MTLAFWTSCGSGPVLGPLKRTKFTDLLQSKFGVAPLYGRSDQFLPFDLNTPGFHLIRDAKLGNNVPVI